MTHTQKALVLALVSTLVACGGGGGGDVESEVVRVDSGDSGVGTGGSSGGTGGGTGGADGGTGGTDGGVAQPVAPPVDPGVAEPVAPEDIQSADDLVAPAELQLKPSRNVILKVELPIAYGGSSVMLCVAEEPLSAPAQINFDDCIYTGKLSGGSLETELSIMNTVPYLVGAVISRTEQDVLLNWTDVGSGQTLLLTN